MKKLVLLICLLQFACTTPRADSGSIEQKPNIIFLFADDLTYEAVHALGNEIIETPNLDKLVKSGTSFSHAYNMGGWNGAICAASRAMLISGRSFGKPRRSVIAGQQWTQSHSDKPGENSWNQKVMIPI